MKKAVIVMISFLLAGCVGAQAPSGEVLSHTGECRTIDEQEIGALFDRWNRLLQTGDPRRVVANYAERSILLPTVSKKPRFTAEEKEDYFQQFLANRPTGSIDTRFVEVGCNVAIDSGHYTFAYADGSQVLARYTFTYKWDGAHWLITSHHSSALPPK